MIKAIIVDDELSAAEVIKALVAQYSSEVIICDICLTIKEAIYAIKHHAPDIIFLDIELSTGTGFEVLEEFPDLNARVVFVTAHEHYAIKAIKHNAFDYVLKPINPREIEAVLKKLTSEIKKQTPLPDSRLLLQYLNNNKKIAVATQNGYQYYEVANILFIEGDGSYSNMYFADGKKVVVSKILKHFEVLLTEKDFLRVHRSYLVNMNHIAEFRKEDRGYLIMTNGKEIPISTSEKEKILHQLRMHTNII